MKNLVKKISLAILAAIMGSMALTSGAVMAEEDAANVAEEAAKAATSISISPVSKILQLTPDTVYEDSFKITNNGGGVMKFEVYASPYSYTFSESDDEYKLGFSNENNYTQITRWITFKDVNGSYTTKPKFSAEPGATVEVFYRISTPSSIPAGGQYAVLFAHTLSSDTTSGGIKTEASPGLVVYGRSSGETVTTGETSSLELHQVKTVEEEKKNIINASAKVKNTGNVDFMAVGTLKVEGVFGRTYYETPSNQGRISVIPESELKVSDEWEDTPYFGLFKATWTVAAAGNTETISQMILIMPAPVIVVMILLLTVIIIWIIIMVRKRKERKSRFMV